ARPLMVAGLFRRSTDSDAGHDSAGLFHRPVGSAPDHRYIRFAGSRPDADLGWDWPGGAVVPRTVAAGAAECCRRTRPHGLHHVCATAAGRDAAAPRPV